MGESKKTKVLGFALLLAEAAVSLFASAYAVASGVPYVGIGPMPWWQYVLRSPSLLWFKVNKNADPFVMMVTLFVVYAVAAFIVLRYLMMKPVLRKLTN